MSTYESSIPGASIYGGAALLAKTAYQKSLARLNDQRGTRLNQAGFEGDINAETGVLNNIRASQTNKYGEFQQLNRSQAMGFEGARNQGIARGLGTGGGLAAQMQSEQRYNAGLQDANFGRSLTGDLAGYQDQQTEAAQQRDAALYQAELAAAQAAQQNSDWSPTDYSGLDESYLDESYGPEDPGPDHGPGAPPVSAAARLAAQTRAKSVAAVKKGTLGQYGWGAAGTLAKAKTAAKPAAKAPPKKILPTKQYLPGQAPTSLAVKNNTSTTAKKKKK